ncbi:ATP-binding protein [Thorsellia anophelis]|uniref:Molecular chaperone HtpG n=1 Tax=Thorsellia anophelis DSM 18579 TaxID=1123402 RepID=A0A1I0DUL1_9GAMM|nr:ATP-binding protein [Thorsellia anophelis]SET36190.1 molecular chaperone HtpG [Thorsellia anophelis DSM 18579]
MQIIDNEESGIEINEAGVDLGGLMTVLSKHLYSTPVVALRELVQNGHDSIVRRRIEDSNAFESSIKITVDSKMKTLTISDSGAGLTLEEIHQYLATVGVGYTRTLRAQNEDSDGLIGMFGLGFLSAFVLASKVQVRTCSYQTPNLTHLYQSRNAQNYTALLCEHRGEVGTDVILTLNENYKELANEQRLNHLLSHYCALLHEPIFIGHNELAINHEVPPWRITEEIHPIQLHKRRLSFAKQFESHFEPITTIPLFERAKTNSNEISVVEKDLKGLLWIQDGAFYGTSDNRNLAVFVRGMLLDDDAKDLLPTWAGFMGGVIESQKLTPTASRETLQKDNYYYEVKHAISESLIEGLAEIAKKQPEAWRRILTRHNEALLAAALCDDRLFNLLQDKVKIPSSEGDILVSRLINKERKIHVMLSEEAGFEDMIFRTLKIPVAYGHRYAVIPFLRKWAQLNNLVLIELGTEKGNQHFFTKEELDEVTTKVLSDGLCDNEQLIVAKFLPQELPLVVVPDREAILKNRLESDEADKRISSAALDLVRQFTKKIETRPEIRVFINSSNPAIDFIIHQVKMGKDVSKSILLLKSMKIIMTASGDSQVNVNLSQALSDISQLVITMND